MWLKRVYIKNFRSIEECTIDLDSGINAFFGENGTGKSNIVRAVLKILGPSYPSVRSFPKEDCLDQDESREKQVALTFDDNGANRELRWGLGNDDAYHLTLDGRWPKDNDRLRFCPVYLPANREVKELPGANTWNPIGRILSELADEIGTETTLIEAFRHKALELNSVLEGSAKFAEFKNKLKTYASEHLGHRGEGLEVVLSLVDPENVLRTAQLFEKVDGKLFNASTSGLGVQNSITIAALRAFSETLGGRLFVVADEPEAFLHPLSQDALRFVFEKIVGSGTQVILTTHSPHFVSPGNLDGLHKVWLDKGRTCVHRYVVETHARALTKYGVADPAPDGIKARLAQQLTIDAREALFARKVVVCEGESEALSLPVWALAQGYDFAASGIAVVPAHGKFSLGPLATFYLTMGMPIYVVFDSDSGKTSDRDKHAAANRGLLSLLDLPPVDFPPGAIGPKCTVFSPDFERAQRSADSEYQRLESAIDEELGLAADGSKAIRALHVALRYRAIGRAAPQPISELVSAIRAFAP